MKLCKSFKTIKIGICLSLLTVFNVCVKRKLLRVYFSVLMYFQIKQIIGGWGKSFPHRKLKRVMVENILPESSN